MKKKNVTPTERVLSALAQVAGNDETRGNLAQIVVKDGLASATNGHILAVIDAEGVPPAHYQRAGKAWVPSLTGEALPDFSNVRSKETFPAFEVPYGALRVGATGLVLDTDCELVWNTLGKKGRAIVEGAFRVTVPEARKLDGRAARVGLDARYMRTVALALGHEIDDTDGKLVVWQCAADIELIQRHAEQYAAAKKAGKLLKHDEAVRAYGAPVELRSTNAHVQSIYGLIMPIRL